jgi:16S rRNA (cytidine1402-2'-O)-methyltransferase
MKGTLYVVATPIGNLKDITLRALEVLKEVDVIACEDTRRAQKLLTHYGIKKPLISYWSGREKLKAQEVLERLRAGQDVALISDAGTPGVSDPGALLVSEAVQEGFEVVPVPGPSALMAALSASGLALREFVFVGFLPSRRTERLKVLRELALERRPVVFYEAPHRLLQSLQDAAQCMPQRQAVVFKELTKLFEASWRGCLQELARRLSSEPVAGEYVVLLGERPKEAGPAPEEALQEVRSLMQRGLGRKEAVKKVAQAYGLSKKELYERSLQ